MGGTAGFLVAVCQVGAERALKQEVLREHPRLRSAFARPGLVTWKSLEGPIEPGFVLRSVFARAFAHVLGPAADAAAVLEHASSLGPGPLRLHLWPRDQHRPGQAPPGAEAAALAACASLRGALHAAAGEALRAADRGDDRARPGERVLDVIVAPGEPHFVGHHRASPAGEGPPAHSPFPGGRPPVEVPGDAPSRAFAKLEEALAWSGAPLAAGQVALEIGSAPGGASLALLRRGLEVVGVDPGEMAEPARSAPGFRHLQLPVGGLRRELLPRRVDWLLLDVNLAPQVALHQVRGVVSALRPGLRGVLFTLKLNDWAMAAQVPALLERVRALGLPSVWATQLPSNRQEICVYGRASLGPGGAAAR